jgi:hypothetical protein
MKRLLFSAVAGFLGLNVLGGDALAQHGSHGNHGGGHFGGGMPGMRPGAAHGMAMSRSSPFQGGGVDHRPTARPGPGFSERPADRKSGQRKSKSLGELRYAVPFSCRARWPRSLPR